MTSTRHRAETPWLPILSIALCGAPGMAWASGIPGAVIQEVLVTGKRIELSGNPVSASVGTALADQLEHRPVLRTGEIFEIVPGLVVTQHSGNGKANQFFLRGFNLDHGTDFASFVDGLPVNMPTHGHGQGYSDLNFLIPELVERLDYRKGPYYADLGNFSAAGAVHARYKSRLEQPFVTLAGGEDQYQRALVGGSFRLGAGELLLAGSHERSDGPWLLEEDLEKSNGLVKFTGGTVEAGWDATLMAYDGSWTSTDQIPLRAVRSGELDRFGFIDPSDGGESHRYSLSASGWGVLGPGRWQGLAYGMDYSLDLFSNFTYFIDAVNGDQFEQVDDRRVYGGDWRYVQDLSGMLRGAEIETGVQVRHDRIDPVGLHLTVARERIATIREDEVRQTSYAGFADLDLRLADWLRANVGMRADLYEFDVESSLSINSGSASDSIVSPKLSFVLGPWRHTELFANYGRGFHSNDARGTTIRVDPNDGVTPVARVDPLVRATGAEIGLRTAALATMQLAASLWTLELDSELLFIGDGGNTEASRPSRRSGIELGVYWTPLEWAIVDADLTWTRPRFTDTDPAGDRIPGAVERVASLGLSVEHPSGWNGGLRVRYLGPAALIEDNSVRSATTTLVNLQAGYRFTERLSAKLALYNAFDERANDITYLYESRLPGESVPVTDIHFHPVEPRTLRGSVTYEFGAQRRL